jgi:hypothetical protein
MVNVSGGTGKGAKYPPSITGRVNISGTRNARSMRTAINATKTNAGVYNDIRLSHSIRAKRMALIFNFVSKRTMFS